MRERLLHLVIVASTLPPRPDVSVLGEALPSPTPSPARRRWPLLLLPWVRRPPEMD